MKPVVKATVLSCGIAVSLAIGEVQGEKQKPLAKAEGKDPKEVKREQPPMQDLILTGKVIQQEKVSKGKDGAEVKRMVYFLETETGNVPLHVEKKKEGGMDVAALVGKTVRVTGQGWIREEKGMKKTVLVKVTALDEVEPAGTTP